jgi:ATP-binding cassette subfamily F protein 3
MLRKDNVLLLDEPTNHLDMDSREVLEAALADFEGTIIAVSHDRYFINRFADKIWVLEGETLKEYLGNYDSYYARVSRDQEPDGDTAGMTRTAVDKEKKRSRDEQRRLREAKEQLKAAEKRVAEAEEELAGLEARLAEPETYRDPEQGAALTKQYNALKETVDRLYAEWEALEEAAQ